MNLLGSNIPTHLRLASRNEGKIKSYESCSDVRAWSHDERARDRYLKEWIKRDMPICVLPVCTLARFLRTMTCRSRARTTPRCHPDCKSKVLLESICTSCHAIKECLKDDPNFDKYFAEEDFETSHWPCDKCLDVLRSIKMFWKIIVERIFGINLSKTEEFENVQDSRTASVKSVAKLWEKELVQQALFVKNVTPLLSRGSSLNKSECPWKSTCLRKETTTRIPRPCNKLDIKEPTVSLKVNKVKSPTSSLLSQRTRTTDHNGRSNISMNRNADKIIRKIHKCTSIRVRMVDEACETCNIESEDLKTFKNNIELLQQRCNCQESEIDKLKRENNSLKIELQNFYKTCSWKTVVQSPIPESPNFDKSALVPKPYECCIEENRRGSSVKNTDSEMIITMKNCRNESFRHVSLLQVLHKTNEPTLSDEQLDAPCSKKENPIDLLTKVQNTFGEIVRREIMIVKSKKQSTRQSDIDASFMRLHNSRSAPSCSTICSESGSSESNFVS
ncbi:uncharacterized protein LOC135088353 isoform X2 [Ostrinia nubilalis]|uniref:uncharacterized protein LOC135088353 isoform X2 n=1 Tax=Ostrinia nubilalis TaxID=29057 RepID=UPI00308251E8